MDQAQQNLPVLAYIVIESPNGIKTEMSFQLDFDCTNKQAEYEALIISLEILADFRLSTVRIIGDSQLVLKQVCGEYKCSSLSLAPYFAMAVQLMDEFDDVTGQAIS
jgi:ribonuclease HI